MAINYTYKPYEEDEYTRRLREAALAAEANKPAGYTGANRAAADEALKKIQNREEFKYDVNNDVLYQQYKDQAMRQGKLAMEDTIGKASALTGGYGNSYAASAGNQAFQMYLDKLNDRIPELYSAAYSKYQQERQNDLDNYKLLAALDEQEYDRANDDYSKWASETDRAYGRYNDAYDRGYKAHSDEQNYLYDIALQKEKSRLEDEANAAKKYQADLDYKLGLKKLYAKEAEDAAEAKTVRDAEVSKVITAMTVGGDLTAADKKKLNKLRDESGGTDDDFLSELAKYCSTEEQFRERANEFGVNSYFVDNYLKNNTFSNDLESAFDRLVKELEKYDLTEDEQYEYYQELFSYYPDKEVEEFVAKQQERELRKYAGKGTFNLSGGIFSTKSDLIR